MSDQVDRLKTALADRYRIERRLGEGGMATVYLAEDLRHERKVALKVLKPELAAVLGAERFVQEIKTTASLQHPNILPLFDSGEADGFLYYVMPYIEGETLRDKLIREKQLRIDEAVGIATEVADALEYAHQQGVIHRDIKPENILLHAGRPMVADFGIALAVSAAAGGRMTETGLSLGTPHYMSPEQASGDRNLDARSDVYALGALAYEMLVGDPPFTGSNVQAVLARVLTEKPTPVRTVREAVSPAVDAAISRSLAKVPADRHGSAVAFARALERVPSDALSPTSRRRLGIVGAVVGIGIAVGIGLSVLSSNGPVGKPAAPLTSIAVLPFHDMSPGGDQTWLGEGTAEAIISALSRLPELRVVARTSAFSMRGQPIALIGDALAVGTVLEGSVRRAGERVRMEARLVSVDDESSLWSRSFEAGMTNIFDVQDSIARAVVRALQVEIGAFHSTSMMSATTANPAAHEQYLRGRYRWNQRSEDGVLAAIGHFRNAVELDSTYAAAWAGLADAYLILPEYSPTASPETVARESEAALAHALQLAPDLPEALTSAAWVELIHRYDWAAAERLFERALAIDSTSVGALHWLSHLLSWQGRHDEAVRWAARAVEVDPLSATLRSNLAYVLMDARQFDAAVDTLLTVIAMDPTFGAAHQTLWETLARSGRWSEASRAWSRWASTIGLDEDAARVVAEAFLQRADGGPLSPPPSAVVNQLELGSQHRGVVLASLGDFEAAMDALDRALLERSGSRSVLSMGINPLYDPIREDPRFAGLLRRAGLRDR